MFKKPLGGHPNPPPPPFVQEGLISIRQNKTVIAHAGIKFKTIHFGSFKLNPKSHEMYDYNPTFPVEFSSRQGFFNI